MPDRNSYEMIVPVEMDVNQIKSLPYNNVLIRYDPKLTDKTNGGILVPKGNWEGLAARSAIRLGEVVKIPERLLFSKSKTYATRSAPWKTKIEIRPGDIVVSDHMESNNAPVYTWKGVFYRIINYHCIDAIKRGDCIIPLNGNILMEQYTKSFSSLSIKEEHDGKTYILKYFGERNTDYLKEGRYDFKMPLKEGDKVIISKEPNDSNDFTRHIRKLEQDEFVKLSDKVLYVAKRYMVAHIERN